MQQTSFWLRLQKSGKPGREKLPIVQSVFNQTYVQQHQTVTHSPISLLRDYPHSAGTNSNPPSPPPPPNDPCPPTIYYSHHCCIGTSLTPTKQAQHLKKAAAQKINHYPNKIRLHLIFSSTPSSCDESTGNTACFFHAFRFPSLELDAAQAPNGTRKKKSNQIKEPPPDKAPTLPLAPPSPICQSLPSYYYTMPYSICSTSSVSMGVGAAG